MHNIPCICSLSTLVCAGPWQVNIMQFFFNNRLFLRLDILSIYIFFLDSTMCYFRKNKRLEVIGLNKVYYTWSYSVIKPAIWAGAGDGTQVSKKQAIHQKVVFIFKF